MNNIVNKFLSMLVVLGSVMAMVILAQSQWNEIHRSQSTLPMQRDNSFGGQMLQPVKTKLPTQTNHIAVSEEVRNSASYQEKKALVISSYQLEDPRR